MAPTETKPESPARSLPPVMDVMPPKPSEPPAPEPSQPSEPAAAAPAPEPVPVAPQEPPKQEVKEPPASSDAPKQEPPKMAHARPVRRHAGGGIGLAIFATLVIVLGLGILMVYAYLRTNGITVL